MRPVPPLIVLAALTTGCSHEQVPAPGQASAPAPATAPASASAAVSASATATATASATASASAPAPAEKPFLIVELAPTQGDLLPLLRAEVARAKGKGLRPFVEFYADWCEPCRALTRSMSDPRMIDAFTGTYIVKLNVDDWQEKVVAAGFEPRVIPMFYAIGEDGRPTGRSINERAWPRTTPSHVAGPLKAFFSG